MMMTMMIAAGDVMTAVMMISGDGDDDDGDGDDDDDDDDDGDDDDDDEKLNRTTEKTKQDHTNN